MSPSENDPVHKLPELKVLAASYVLGEMSVALKEINVVEDLLKAQPESLLRKAASEVA